jgi:predicted metal-dependent hydrolase
VTQLGRVYDLQSLFERLNRLYFDSTLKIEISWGSREPTKARRSAILGSYCPRRKKITISKRLDRIDVPLYFVEHVLFHEMLHHVFPAEKHRMHTEKFKSFERLHPDYQLAKDWEKKSSSVLMGTRQKNLPFLNA